MWKEGSPLQYCSWETEVLQRIQFDHLPSSGYRRGGGVAKSENCEGQIALLSGECASHEPPPPPPAHFPPQSRVRMQQSSGWLQGMAFLYHARGW